MDLIKEIIIENPPTFYQIKKVKKSLEAGHDVYDKYYLTANLFFNNATSYHIISKIVQEVKLYLKKEIGVLPELEKMYIEVEFHCNKDIDLDNRFFFWMKILQDILKTPTPKQIHNANLKGKSIITTNTVVDDDTKCITGFKCDFVKGGNALIFKIYGRVKSEQKEMDLFFI